MRIVLLAILVFAISPISAQDYLLQIYVVDAATNEPLPFVNVQVSPSMQGGTTNEKGKLNLNLPSGQITVRSSFIGYEDQEKRFLMNRDIKLDLALEPSGENLETIVVTDRDERELIERPEMGVEQLSMSDVKSIPLILGELDVLKGLQLRSGVSSAGEASNGISIRGGTIDQNLTLYDGAPVFTPTHLFGLFSVFTPDAVGSVNLYRANVPSRFGGRIASVIDVRSRSPNNEGFRMQGGIGLVSSHLAIETPLTNDGKLSVLAAGRVGVNDFLFNIVERLKNTESRFADATLKFRYLASKNSIFTLSGFFSSDYYQVNLINNLANINSSVNRYRYQTLNGSLEWLKLINDKTNWRSRIIRSDFQPDLLFPEEGSEIEVSFESRLSQLSFQSELDHQVGSHFLSGGFHADRYYVEPGELKPNGSTAVNGVQLPEENGLELALFVEDRWEVTDKLTVSMGLRYSHFRQLGPAEERIYAEGEERSPTSLLSTVFFAAGNTLQTYGGFEPRFGINYELNEFTSAKGAFAVSRQYLQNIYNATTPLPTSRWKVSDASIVPQLGTMVSAGLYRLLNEGRYKLSLEGYYRKSNHILEYKPGADFFLEERVETELLQGDGTAYGVEVSIEKTTGRLTGQLNYAYARSFNQVDGPTFTTRVNEGLRYPGYFDQPHTMNLNLVVDKGRIHELGFNLVVQSNRPYTVPNGFVEVSGLTVPLFLERNNARLPVYHRLDFSWTIHNFKREKRRFVADWVFTVYNLYGRDNAYNIFFAPKNTNVPFQNGLFGGSPLASYKLSIFAAPVFSLTYKFTFK